MTTATHPPMSLHRKGVLYPSGEEARRFDQVEYRKDGQVGRVSGVRADGRILVRWPAGARYRRQSTIRVENLRFVGRG